jgi:hypothetical protein
MSLPDDEADARVTGSSVRLRPRAVWIGRSLRVPLRLPAYRVRLPRLPHRLTLIAVETAPVAICLCGTIPRCEGTLSMTAVAQLLDPLSILPELMPGPPADDRAGPGRS